jgi:branched-chain amino acid transport system substrate-binding protein
MKKQHFILIALAILIVTVVIRLSNNNHTTDSESLTVGAVLPQSGPLAFVSDYIENGFTLALEDIEKQAGQRKISLRIEDSAGQPAKGIAAFRNLVASDVKVVVVAASVVASATAPLSNEFPDVMQCYTAVSAPGLPDGVTKFRLYPTAEDNAGRMSSFAGESIPFKTASIFHINDEYGLASARAFSGKMAEFGKPVAFTESYERTGSDFKSLTQERLTGSNPPDLVFVAGYGPAYGALLRQIREVRKDVIVCGDMSLGTQETRDQIGSAAEGFYYVDGPMSDSFYQRYLSKFGKPPSSYSGYAYDLLSILAQSETSAPQQISKRLQGISRYSGVMGLIDSKPSGETSLQFSVYRIQNGRASTID